MKEDPESADAFSRHALNDLLPSPQLHFLVITLNYDSTRGLILLFELKIPQNIAVCDLSLVEDTSSSNQSALLEKAVMWALEQHIAGIY